MAQFSDEGWELGIQSDVEGHLEALSNDKQEMVRGWQPWGRDDQATVMRDVPLFAGWVSEVQHLSLSSPVLLVHLQGTDILAICPPALELDATSSERPSQKVVSHLILCHCTLTSSSCFPEQPSCLGNHFFFNVYTCACTCACVSVCMFVCWAT